MITRTKPNCQTEIGDLQPLAQNDWRSILSNAKLTLAELLAKVEIDPLAFAHSASTNRLSTNDNANLLAHDGSVPDFPLRVPEPFIQRMVKGDINDPLLRQVLPMASEHDITPGYTSDPLQESSFNVAPGLIHKYRGRALFIVSKACAIHCRYCFRRHFPYEDNQPGKEEWATALSYIRQHRDINEIIYSGGDPLASGDKHLAWLSAQIADIPHIQRLRIHTRLPVVLPQRVDQALLDWLNDWHGQKVVVIHSNHANELNDDVKMAIDRLKSTGATVLNQTVLLKGINDSVPALKQLSEKLFAMGVMPYYLHLLDPVAGAAHFDVSDARAKRLIGAVSAELPGYLVPKLVREQAHKSCKTPLLPTL